MVVKYSTAHLPVTQSRVSSARPRLNSRTSQSVVSFKKSPAFSATPSYPWLLKGMHFEQCCVEATPLLEVKEWIWQFFHSYQFTKIRAAPAAKLSAQAIAERKTKKTKRASEGIVRGKPLPEDGACKHYKKSMRWLRFPCCGRGTLFPSPARPYDSNLSTAFPCDQCHDEQTDHKCDWAKRMICGTYTDVILRC